MAKEHLDEFIIEGVFTTIPRTQPIEYGRWNGYETHSGSEDLANDLVVAFFVMIRGPMALKTAPLLSGLSSARMIHSAISSAYTNVERLRLPSRVGMTLSFLIRSSR